jgi:hypothetical protein
MERELVAARVLVLAAAPRVEREVAQPAEREAAQPVVPVAELPAALEAALPTLVAVREAAQQAAQVEAGAAEPDDSPAH